MAAPEIEPATESRFKSTLAKAQKYLPALPMDFRKARAMAAVRSLEFEGNKGAYGHGTGSALPAVVEHASSGCVTPHSSFDSNAHHCF